MLNRSISRRDFLKVASIFLAGVLSPLARLDVFTRPRTENSSVPWLGRVTRKSVGVKAEPDAHSKRLYSVYRDTLLPLLEEIDAASSPMENPTWYRLADGYVNSAYIQRVEKAHINEPLSWVPEGGLLGEVTVPYTQTLYQSRSDEQIALYRIYFQSLHWITGMSEDLDGNLWYRLKDERLQVEYFAPATDLRAVTTQDLTPLSPDIPEVEKRILVSLEKQRLEAYEGDQPVFQVRVSTGRPYMETPSGEFRINRKCPSKHMGDGGLTSDRDAYELVGVPWVSFFHNNGVAFHGTFWHDNFGVPMSQGCVNMRNEDAKWLFRWCTPVYELPADFHTGRKLVEVGPE
jgi:hypothetical protein